jgi:hypothetical protein
MTHLPHGYESIPTITEVSEDEIRTAEKVLKLVANYKAIGFGPSDFIRVHCKTLNILRWMTGMSILTMDYPFGGETRYVLGIDTLKCRAVVMQQKPHNEIRNFEELRDATEDDKKHYPVVDCWGDVLVANTEQANVQTQMG